MDIAMHTNTNERSIPVRSPSAGQERKIDAQAVSGLALDFDPGAATVQRPAGSYDLIFSMNGGGSIRLKGFFASVDGALPFFILPDGTEVAAVDLLAGSLFDMNTTAGPAVAPSGGTSYDDNAGEFISGVDKSAMLEADGWFAYTAGIGGLSVRPAPAADGRGQEETGAAETPKEEASGSVPPAGRMEERKTPPDGLYAFISIRPLLPDEYPLLNDILGTGVMAAGGIPRRMPDGVSVSEDGSRLVFAESLLDTGSPTSGETDAASGIPAPLVYEIQSDDGLVSLTIDGTEYFFAARESADGSPYYVLEDATGAAFRALANGGVALLDPILVPGSAGVWYLAFSAQPQSASDHGGSAVAPQSDPAEGVYGEIEGPAIVARGHTTSSAPAETGADAWDDAIAAPFFTGAEQVNSTEETPVGAWTCAAGAGGLTGIDIRIGDSVSLQAVRVDDSDSGAYWEATFNGDIVRLYNDGRVTFQPGSNAARDEATRIGIRGDGG